MFFVGCRNPDLGEPTLTLVPFGRLNPCLQGTSVQVVSPQPLNPCLQGTSVRVVSPHLLGGYTSLCTHVFVGYETHNKYEMITKSNQVCCHLPRDLLGSIKFLMHYQSEDSRAH